MGSIRRNRLPATVALLAALLALQGCSFWGFREGCQVWHAAWLWDPSATHDETAARVCGELEIEKVDVKGAVRQKQIELREKVLLDNGTVREKIIIKEIPNVESTTNE